MGRTIEGPAEGFAFIPIEFTVIIWGDLGKTDVLPIPTDCFAITAKGPNLHGPVPITTIAKKPGEYTLIFKLSEIGDYSLAFNLFGKPLETTPRHLKITNKHPALLCSILYTEGIDNAIVRVPSKFQVVAKDVHGKDVVGAKFEVVIKGVTKQVPVVLQDFENGSYGVTYKPKEAGKLNVSVKLDGQNVVGSPFIVYAVPSDCLVSMMKGKGCWQGAVHEKLSFEIVAHLQSNFKKKTRASISHCCGHYRTRRG